MFIWKILKKSSPLKKYSPLIYYKYTFIHILHISSQCVTRLVQTIVQPTAITHSHIQKKELTHDPFFLLLWLCEISERDKKNLVCLKLPWVVSQISTGWKIYLSGFCQLNFNGFLFVQKYGTIGQNIIFVLQIYQLNRKHLVEGERYFTSVFSNKRSQFVIDLLCILFWGYFVERRGLKKFCWKEKKL